MLRIKKYVQMKIVIRNKKKKKMNVFIQNLLFYVNITFYIEFKQ